MRGDGAGFLKLEGGSVTLLGSGTGATLDAQRRGRMFYVTGGNLTLDNLQIVNGLAQVHLTPAYPQPDPTRCSKSLQCQPASSRTLALTLNCTCLASPESMTPIDLRQKESQRQHKPKKPDPTQPHT